MLQCDFLPCFHLPLITDLCSPTDISLEVMSVLFFQPVERICESEYLDGVVPVSDIVDSAVSNGSQYVVGITSPVDATSSEAVFLHPFCLAVSPCIIRS